MCEGMHPLAAWHRLYSNIFCTTQLINTRKSSSHNKMASLFSRRDARGHRGEIIPNAIMIKNIPLHWKPDDMLNLINQKKLPSPKALTYLYNDHGVFRGMAFANFNSSGEAWHVIHELNYYRVCGQPLFVQPKRKRLEITSRDGTVPVRPFEVTSNRRPTVSLPDKAHQRPQATTSSGPRTTREQTPPSESYNLLMSYQKNPVEKEKLRRFLAQTGDYQEAVNEFAKNRARETQAGEHGCWMEDGPILERRPPTPGEQMEVEEMDNELGIGGGVTRSGSAMVKHQEEQSVIAETEKGLLQGRDLASIKMGSKLKGHLQSKEKTLKNQGLEGVEKG